MMPVFIGCVDQKSFSDGDLFWPMTWGQKTDSTYGVIDPPTFDLIYQNQHNELVGETWKSHLDEFAKFVSQHAAGDVLEIGAGHGQLPKNIFNSGLKHNLNKWDILEPNPLDPYNEYGEMIQDWFPTRMGSERRFGSIVNSHVLEHQISPYVFLWNCMNSLILQGRLIISWPNMKEMARNIDLNLLMFEHLTYLPVEEVSSMIEELGFRIIETKFFRNHSVFMAVEKTREILDKGNYHTKVSEGDFEFICEQYKSKIESTVQSFNEFLNYNFETTWIFGAHIFTQYLIASGLEIAKIKGVIDNSSNKVGKRLYGTDLKVHSVTEVSKFRNFGVLLPMGNYENEIIHQLREIFPGGTKILGIRSGLTVV